jgi:hypothetical protein
VDTSQIKDMRDRLEVVRASVDDIAQRNGQGSDLGRLSEAVRELSVSLGHLLAAAESDVAEGGTTFTEEPRPIQN